MSHSLQTPESPALCIAGIGIAEGISRHALADDKLMFLFF
jgi:hypothetical protein